MRATEVFIVPGHLYRLGNATSPRLDHVRTGRDIATVKRDGVDWVVLDGKGISVFTAEGIARSPMLGWVWRVPTAALPTGLRIIADNLDTGHCVLAPTRNMTLATYVGLLQELTSRCTKVHPRKSDGSWQVS